MITVSRQDGVGVINMGDGKVNAMSLEFCVSFTELLCELESDPIQSIVISSSERVFSAGVDLLRVIEENREYLNQFLPELAKMLETLYRFPKPTIASVNGHAIAGGCVVAACCDHRFIAPKARIGVPELLVGVPFPTVAFEIMRSVVTPSVFRDMIYGGTSYTGEQSVRAGLADEVVDRDSILDCSITTAKRLAAIPAVVFQYTKQQMQASVWQNISSGKQQFESRCQQIWTSPEVRTAMTQYARQTFRS